MPRQELTPPRNRDVSGVFRREDLDRPLKEAREHLQTFIKESKLMVQEAIKNGDIQNVKDHRPTHEDIQEAKEIVTELLAAGEVPQVTVSRQHLSTILREGLKERPTAYQKRVTLLVGTLGQAPLLPADEDRVVLRLHLKPDELEPRFTGPENIFQGVVRIRRSSVSPHELEVADPRPLSSDQGIAV